MVATANLEKLLLTVAVPAASMMVLLQEIPAVQAAVDLEIKQVLLEDLVQLAKDTQAVLGTNRVQQVAVVVVAQVPRADLLTILAVVEMVEPDVQHQFQEVQFITQAVAVVVVDTVQLQALEVLVDKAAAPLEVVLVQVPAHHLIQEAVVAELEGAPVTAEVVVAA
jgi:hypothetical protein